MPARYCTHCGHIITEADWRKHQRAHQERQGSTRQWRNLRQHILDRDNHQCQICGATTNLEIHHLDGDWRNNHPANLQTVCTTHNPRGPGHTPLNHTTSTAHR